MIPAETFIQAAKAKGFGFYTGVPCSYLKSFINAVIDSPELHYVAAANEGDAVAIASGVQLAGMRGAAMFQNSGFGNAVNPLTSLNQTLKIPILLIVTWRGQPDGAPDEPQHKLMGAITPQLLELMGIPWEFFPTEAGEIEPVLERAIASMDRSGTPYALVMKKGTVESCELSSQLPLKPLTPQDAAREKTPASCSRQEMLETIQTVLEPETAILATTGYTGRELYALSDRPNQLYMVGSMGCVSSLGLGIALAKPQQPVAVIDGDGAALMRLGALATVGYERPSNLLHILLDNQCHESTGGQSTVSSSIDWAGIAAACGYEQISRASTREGLKTAMASAAGKLTFIHVKITPGIPPGLPRPKITPDEVARRLQQFLSMGNR